MSEETQTQDTTQDTEKETNKALRLSDDLIAVVRELIQLSLLTGTNIVDHMRAVQCEVLEGAVVPTVEYINAYNAQIAELAKQAEKEAEAMQEQVAGDDDSSLN